MTVAYKTTDKATDHLLDFIAGGVPDNPSGESAGNYDAVFGDIDGDAVLAEMTLSQIYAMQTDMLAENGISTATGRYQGLKSTIQEYQDRAYLPDSELFTETLQDDFGLTKMVDRGYQLWWTGEIDDNEFMHRLSCEWASLPDPYNGGKSHYDGDSAGNHASTSLDCFHTALVQAREYIDGEEGGRRDPPQLTIPTKPLGEVERAKRAIEAIQCVLVLTGDLPGRGAVDGIWGMQSETALNALISRSTL